MDKSLIAFATFKDNLRKKIQHSNGDKSFNARVIYSWNNQTQQETLEVTLSLTTFEYGRIRIEDGEDLYTENVHLDSNPKFQEYSYGIDGILIVNGNSPKLGGAYEVKIIEV
jgi:hypothetical protein